MITVCNCNIKGWQHGKAIAAWRIAESCHYFLYILQQYRWRQWMWRWRQEKEDKDKDMEGPIRTRTGISMRMPVYGTTVEDATGARLSMSALIACADGVHSPAHSTVSVHICSAIDPNDCCCYCCCWCCCCRCRCCRCCRCCRSWFLVKRRTVCTLSRTTHAQTQLVFYVAAWKRIPSMSVPSARTRSFFFSSKCYTNISSRLYANFASVRTPISKHRLHHFAPPDDANE